MKKILGTPVDERVMDRRAEGIQWEGRSDTAHPPLQYDEG